MSSRFLRIDLFINSKADLSGFCLWRELSFLYNVAPALLEFGHNVMAE